jgi:amidase
LYRYSRALARRDACIGKVERFLSGYDAWLCPVAMVPALPHADLKTRMEVVMARASVNGREVQYDLATFGYTSPFNLTGSPVVCLPAGATASGLPAGLQVVGKRWRDFQLLDTAEMIAGALGRFRPPPALE